MRISDWSSDVCSSDLGVCLTVVERGEGWFAADVSGETLARSTLGDWRAGTPVNLERPLRLGDELGGHMLSGHVDGVAVVRGRQAEQGSLRLTVAAPAALAKFIASQGSVALDGVSLTVNGVGGNEVAGASFGVNIIPHTAEVTTLGARQPGARVNMEMHM